MTERSIFTAVSPIGDTSLNALPVKRIGPAFSFSLRNVLNLLCGRGIKFTQL